MAYIIFLDGTMQKKTKKRNKPEHTDAEKPIKNNLSKCASKVGAFTLYVNIIEKISYNKESHQKNELILKMIYLFYIKAPRYCYCRNIATYYVLQITLHTTQRKNTVWTNTRIKRVTFQYKNILREKQIQMHETLFKK